MLTRHVGHQSLHRKEHAKAELENCPEHNDADVDKEDGCPMSDLQAPAHSHVSASAPGLADHRAPSLQPCMWRSLCSSLFLAGGSLEGLQHGRLAIGLAAEGYGVHQAGQDERHPRLCNETRSLRRLQPRERPRGYPNMANPRY